MTCARAPGRPAARAGPPAPSRCGPTAARPDRSPRWCTAPPGPAPRRARPLRARLRRLLLPHAASRDALADAGYDLFALDLRDYGRSIQRGPPGQLTYRPGRVRRGDRRRDRASCARTTTRSSCSATRWAGWSRRCGPTPARGDGPIDALVLNSPWLDLRGSWFERTVLTAVLDVVGQASPRTSPSAKLGRFYGEALHEGTGGEWDYDLAWKPHDGFPVRAGFDPHRAPRAQAGGPRASRSTCPVLVLASDASGPDDVLARRSWSPPTRCSTSRTSSARAPTARPGRHVRRDPRRRARPRPVPAPAREHVRRRGARVPRRPAAVRRSRWSCDRCGRAAERGLRIGPACAARRWAALIERIYTGLHRHRAVRPRDDARRAGVRLDRARS